MLGLDPDAADGALTLTASLPEWLGSIEMTRLRAGVGSADFRIASTPPGVMTLGVRGASGADLKLTGGPAPVAIPFGIAGTQISTAGAGRRS